MGSSVPELLLAAQLEQAGIPFEREFLFAKSMGRKWRADFGLLSASEWYLLESFEIPLAQLVDTLVEIDGGVWLPKGRHTTGSGFEADAEKQSAAAILGYRVIRVTPKQVDDGRALLWIQQALGLAVAA